MKTYASINRAKGFNNEHSLFSLIQGYRATARHLLQELIKSEDWLQIDSIIYPALFVFRHYMELIMKDTLRYHRLINGEIDSDHVGFKNEHSLQRLWKELRPYLDETYKHEANYPTDMATMDALLQEFESYDHGSFAFRYPYDGSKNKKKQIVYTLGFMTINLANLQQVVDRTIAFFDGINAHAAVLLDETQSNAYN